MKEIIIAAGVIAAVAACSEEAPPTMNAAPTAPVAIE